MTSIRLIPVRGRRARLGEALTQFLARLSGERHGQDVISIEFTLGDLTLNAKGENVRFTGTGGSANEKLAMRRRHGLTLLGC